MSPYVCAITEGVPCIEEGRRFMLDERSWSIGSLVPPVYGPTDITKDGVVAEIHVAGTRMLSTCLCGKPLSQHLLMHDMDWMHMAFACPVHTDTVWIDISPKANGPDTSWDRTNLWRLPSSAREEYRAMLDRAPLRFRLTQTGLVETRKVWGWTALFASWSLFPR